MDGRACEKALQVTDFWTFRFHMVSQCFNDALLSAYLQRLTSESFDCLCVR